MGAFHGNKANLHKILILDNSLEMGGLEKKLFDFVTRIDEKRFKVAICCLKQGGYFKEAFQSIGTPFYENLLRYKYDVLAYRRLSRILSDEKVDLIYSFAHPNTIFFSYVPMLTGSVRGWVVSLHATGSPSGGRLIGRFQKLFLSRVSRFIAVAHVHKRYLVEVEGLPEERIEVIHNGVDVVKFHPGSPEPSLKRELGIREGERVVTSVASLRPVKRIDTLLHAASHILERYADVRFLLVGDGIDRAHLEQLAQELGIAGSVTFAGIRSDVDAILRASDIFVLSSATEAFPNAVLEAMASGLPVVSTDVGGVRELVADGESGMIVPPENPDALAQAIDVLLTEEDRAAAFGRKGRRIVEEQFTLEQMCEKRQLLFEELLCSSR
jgi:glycosyltransferase involved in cell wall biosynthesis